MAKLVVLVEDDPDARKVVASILERQGCQIESAEDGRSGWDLIRKRHPDAVVLDVMLPKMNGYEICVEMQKDEKLKNIPIMVVTGLTNADTPEAEEKWRESMGVAEFVSKPFSPEDLARRVKRMLEEE